MNTLRLDSVDVDDSFLWPAESEEHARERVGDLTLYEVGMGERRIRITPSLPTSWHGTLGTYMATIGCPTAVREAIVQKAHALLGKGLVDGPLQVAASR